jgi:hypothetical protein
MYGSVCRFGAILWRAAACLGTRGYAAWLCGVCSMGAFFIRNSRFRGTQTRKCGLRFEGSARDTLTTIIKFKKEIVVNFVEFRVNDFKN